MRARERTRETNAVRYVARCSRFVYFGALRDCGPRLRPEHHDAGQKGGPFDAVAIRQRIDARRAARRTKHERRQSRDRARRDLPTFNVEHARELGIEVNRHGWARCFAHDDNSPSLHVNPKKGRAFCNVCGKSWDGIALVMELRGLEFPAAVRWLNNEPGPMRRTA